LRGSVLGPERLYRAGRWRFGRRRPTLASAELRGAWGHFSPGPYDP